MLLKIILILTSAAGNHNKFY